MVNRFGENIGKKNSHEIVGVSSRIDIVQLLQILASSFLLVDASHVLGAAPGQFLLAQWLLRLGPHGRSVVYRHLALHITPR